MKPIERVRHLIQLAASAPEEEARTAAVQACRLITQHGLVIGVPKPKAKPTVQPAPTSPDPRSPASVTEIVREVALEAASRVTARDVADVFTRVLTGNRRR